MIKYKKFNEEYKKSGYLFFLNKKRFYKKSKRNKKKNLNKKLNIQSIFYALYKSKLKKLNI